MCGIAGFISAEAGEEELGRAVARMCAAMQHRGSDDEGRVVQEGAALGMRRLAIFDPANGKQPMASADGRYWIVLNGAIVNHPELRRELAGLGHAFRSECDTEVLLAAYVQWGRDCLRRLRGMFAFAVWDVRERVLFAARDALGVKPLYYARRPSGGLLFASELRALAASGQVACAIDPAAVSEYLAWSAVPAPRTIYSDCSALLPGHALYCDRLGRVRTEPWWQFPEVDPRDALRGSEGGTVGAAAHETFRRQLRYRLEEVARLYARSDVPLGAFLSGGLDSSACVALLRHSGARELKTFSIVFDEAGYSEESAAKMTADALRTEHHELRLTGARLAEDLPSILHSFDQPGGDGINTYYASLAAKEGGVTVAVSGLGGDELFGGYPSFKDVPRLARWLPRWRMLPMRLRQMIVARLRSRTDMRSRLLADWLGNGRDIHELAAMRRRSFAEPQQLALLAPEARRHAERLGPLHPLIDSLPLELSGTDDFQIISAWELRSYMSDILLRDSDAFSMAHSLELRVPLIDSGLVEWVWAQPTALKYDARITKWGLAEATRDLLPRDILERKKQGFSLPFSLWMRGPLRPFLEECFSAKSLGECPWLNGSVARTMWEHFVNGNDSRAWSRVWSLAMLVTFCQRKPIASARGGIVA